MNWLERWFLKRLCRKLVIQSPSHKRNIIEYFQIMKWAAKREFVEDNQVSLEAFLLECLRIS
jgi:hypothetical protein